MTSDEGGDDFWGFVQDSNGLFESQEDGLRQVEPLGCSPQGVFLASLDHLGTRRATAGGAHLAFLDAEGIEMGSYFVSGMTTTAARSSVHGDGLFDVEVRLWCDELLPGAAEIWDLLRTGNLDRKGMWEDLDAVDRKTWLSVALWSREYRRGGAPPPISRFSLRSSPTTIRSPGRPHRLAEDRWDQPSERRCPRRSRRRHHATHV
ncbi:hypothetical protein ACYSUO_32690 [Streptomyces sp. UC4497]